MLLETPAGAVTVTAKLNASVAPMVVATQCRVRKRSDPAEPAM